MEKSEKDWTITLILAFLLGYLGVHRFYAGKTGTGIAMLLTMGGCGIWTIIDIVQLIMGNFTDGEGKVITNKEV